MAALRELTINAESAIIVAQNNGVPPQRQLISEMAVMSYCAIRG